jgi:uncharacterized membrane protein HdeD (DUF308 family)
MLLGIILTIAGFIGIIYGISKKSRALVIASAIVLIGIASIGLYIFKNPY